VNRDPRRGIGHEKVLTRLELDHQAELLMSRAGKTRDHVLADGERFFLRRTGNLSTGGTAIDLTDQIHPDNREMAVRAAKAIGLDVIGVDFITSDITRSYREVGGGICEVNAAPGFRMHVAPTEGKPRDVAGPVMDMLFPRGTPAKIPIAAITGTNGKTTTARMLAHVQKLAGHVVGLATTDGVYIDGERTVVGDMTGPQSAQMILRDPSVDLAVLETARGGLVRAGLGYRSCNVGAVLNVSSDHLGLRGVETLEQLAEVKRIVVEVARDVAVLNADDLLCLRMGDHTGASRIAYVTMNPRHDLVRRHIRSGGLACVLEEGINGQMITLFDHGAHLPLLWTHLIPATLEGKALFNVQNAMFAAVMAHAMGVKAENIRHGLRTFDSSYTRRPGGSTSSTTTASRSSSTTATTRRRCRPSPTWSAGFPSRAGASACSPGRAIAATRTCARSRASPRRSFDQVVLRRDDDLRGRGSDDVPRMMAREMLEHGFPEERLRVVPDEQEAIDVALALARRGDLLVIFADKISRSWKQVIYWKRPEQEGEPPAPPPPAPAPPPPAPAPTPVPAPANWIEDQRGVRLARESED
jgi:cyanophycin synthetase